MAPRWHRSHRNKTYVFMGKGGVQVRVAFMRAEERSHDKSVRWGREDTSGLNKGSETRDKGGWSAEALACFHQQNCNHTV